jgi:hypothetical protein
MAFGDDKRLYRRIPVNWPAVVVTAEGSIAGEVRNISVGGAFIQLSEEGDFSGDLQIFLKPSEQRSISLTCREAWSGNLNFHGKTIFSGLGVQFTNISPEDKEFITSLASAYRNQHDGSPQNESSTGSVTLDEAELSEVR